MAYIGRGIQWGEFNKQRIGVAGGTGPLFDGIENTWALDFSSNENSLLVVIDGAILEPGIGFTTEGVNITLTTPPALAAIGYVVFLGQELTNVSMPTHADLQSAVNTASEITREAVIDEAIAYSISLGSLS
tara:strand:- start:2110 stop:2502 length:393 start_codon:yes stop_codon:yes gene_type:complete